MPFLIVPDVRTTVSGEKLGHVPVPSGTRRIRTDRELELGTTHGYVKVYETNIRNVVAGTAVDSRVCVYNGRGIYIFDVI